MQDKAFYFTKAEFYVLLGLSGKPECSFLEDGEEPDNEALRQAVVSLFGRGLLRRRGKGLEVCGLGNLFRCFHHSPYAVLVSGGSPLGYTAVCYMGTEQVWVAEIADVLLDRQYRVRALEQEEWGCWLMETGMLVPPVLSREDLLECGEALLEDAETLDGQVLLRLEIYRNGKKLLCCYEICSGRYGQVIRRSENENQDVMLYTKEAVSQMLRECWGVEK